jgi:D-3-phosphoglycerate dehydrogenase
MADNFRVLLSDSLAPQGIEVLTSYPRLKCDIKTGLKPAELAEIIAPYEALIIRSGTRVTKEVIDAATSLKVIGRAGVGVDNVDLEAATRRGIVVMNSPTGNSVTTAEHAISMMMALARHIPAANAAIHSGKWERGKFTGAEVCNKTLGIVGLGNIGRIVADRALGLKMKVIGYDPIVTAEAAGRVGVELVTLNDLFERSDFITVHTPLTDDTRGIVGAAAFAKMKKGVRIINCARGGIVDETALADALRSGKVAGAALDVFVEEPPPANHPLLQFENVIATPHLGAATDEAQVQVSVDIAHQVAEFLLDGTIRHAVNIPAVSPQELEILGPHLTLGEKLGRLAAQLITEAPKELTLAFGGEAANLKPDAITAAVLKGLMSGFLDEELNYVNAPFIARERGINVTETRSREITDYLNTLTLTVKTGAGEHEVAGAVLGNRALRLTRIDGYHVEAVPEGYFLMLHNRDVPGVVGAVGSMLGQAGINIGGLELGRDRVGGTALSIFEVDEPVPSNVLERLKTLPAITAASLLKL